MAYRRDLVEIGHLAESLVARSKLQQLLDQIHSDLTPTYLCTHLRVKLLTLTDMHTGFWVTILQIEAEEFSVWHILNAPFRLNDSLHQLSLDNDKIGMGFRSGKLIAIDDCLYGEPKLCPAPVEFDDGRLMGIITTDASRVSQCPLRSLSLDRGVVRRIG